MPSSVLPQVLGMHVVHIHTHTGKTLTHKITFKQHTIDILTKTTQWF